MFGRTLMGFESTKLMPPEAPQWLIEKISRPKGRVANTDKAPASFMSPGCRNNDLTSLAGYYRRRGLNEDAIREQLEAANSIARIPLGKQEVQRIAQSIARNYEADPGGKLNDVQLSRRLAEYISDTCRFVPGIGWKYYDGRSWLQDVQGVRSKERIKTEIEMYVESIRSGGNLDAAGDARKYLTNAKVKAVLELVQTDPAVLTGIEKFDSNPQLLNLKNGTIDLASGILRPHAAEDLLTKVANVECTPSADCPLFKKVLYQSLPHEHAAFLLRYFGYALVGEPIEQVLAILHGAGANGKSTIVNAVSHLMGGYAANVEPGTLIKQKTEKIRTDIARLHGVHLAVTSELATGEILDSALVKRFTGGDTITARALYSLEFEFKPKFSLVMTTNALPVIDGADAALARRLILVPFRNVVPEAERDPRLSERLKSEASGIFNLLLAGLQEYRDIGLDLPGDLKKEVAQFAASSDMLASFLSDEAQEMSGTDLKSSVLYASYSHWCVMRGLRRLSSPVFKRELEKKGYLSKRTRSGQVWVGLRLRPSQL